MRRLALVTLAALALAAPARAVTPDEQLPDPRLEARARALSQELRCLVCQNQSIDDSNAPLAHDLRVILRERLAAGDTDAQAKAYLVTRYGDFVLLRPPFQPDTWALWLGPFAVLLAGGRRRRAGRFAARTSRRRGHCHDRPARGQDEGPAQ